MTRSTSRSDPRPYNPVQQASRGHLCVACGGPVQPRPYKFVPRPPARCQSCKQLHRRRALLRAYLVSAVRLARALGRDDVATALDRPRALAAAEPTE